MKEEPIQKEFGEIEHDGNVIRIRSIVSEGREVVGEGMLVPVDNPALKYYRFFDFKVNKKEYGKGFGSQIMSEVEAMSRRTGRPVVLLEHIELDKNPKAVGLYGRRGWTLVQNPNWMFNRYIYGTDNTKLSLLKAVLNENAS